MPHLQQIGRALCGLGLFLFCSCDLGYYSHLAVGQGSIIWGRQSVENILASDTLSSEMRNQLELALSVIDFAEEIGLHTGTNYHTYYDTQGAPISWNISASPPDSFTPYTWDFPIVGALPYKGFFKKERAKIAYDKLVQEGYDAILRPVNAYSTLGYFSDPLLSTMLNDPPDELANLILHELTHSTIFIDDHTDFNESLATFIGQKGSLIFLRQHFGPNTEYLLLAQNKRADAQQFRDFMGSVVASLDSLYSVGLPRQEVLAQREQIFKQYQNNYRKILPSFHNPDYRFFLEWIINNARLLSYRRYNNQLTLFESIFAQQDEDLAQSIEIFTVCSEKVSPWDCLKKEVDSN